MSNMNENVMKAMEKSIPACIATASAEGNPNIVYVTYIKAIDEKTLVVADNKFEKTRANLNSNPRLSVVVLDPDTHTSYQIKCSAQCYMEGDKYNEVVNWVHVKHPQMTPKAAFYLNVEEVYSGAERLA